MDASGSRVPGATYRLQLREEFGFDDAAAIAGYLAALGVTHAYTSPIVQAASGSAHGYDGADPTRVSDDLGGPAGVRALTRALDVARLGLVVDIVPNHLGVADAANHWWQDVLRHGRRSRYATWFDIDWTTDDPELDGKVLLPILAGSLHAMIADGTIRVGPAGDEWTVQIGEVRLPIAPGTLGSHPPDSPDELRSLLERQHYVLADWHEGLTRLNYRRFFDVTSLAGVRVELPEVFDAVHRLVLELVASGAVDGIRVDHVDGLADPVGYLERLAAAAPGAWRIVEKILVDDEQLDPCWPVDGTTGYDALAELTDALIDPSGRDTIDALHVAVTGDATSFAEATRQARADVIAQLLQPEVRRCAADLQRLAAACDVQIDAEPAARLIAAFAVEMPVYRTYAWPGRPTSPSDAAVISTTVDRVIDRHPDASPRALAVLADALLHPAPEALELVRHLQQLTGPVMAKGIEDTTFYRDVRFVALNEVGGDPATFGADVSTFHRRMAQRAEHWPRSMVTTSTHDTKRSEDVRARLAVLSEIAGDWAAIATRWSARTAAWWPSGVARDPSIDLLLHQTVVGAHPLDGDRAHAYLEKAMREAKRATSWLRPDDEFETAAHSVLERMLTDEQHQSEVRALAERLLVPGRVNALSQKLLVLTMPGVPDVYQGTELWDLSLVDPDNRRPVDYELRRRLLATIPEHPSATDAAGWTAALADPDDPGIAKLAVVHLALAARRDHRDSFLGPAATYSPLTTQGPAAHQAVAYTRGADIAVVVPRHTVRRVQAGGWQDTTVELPPGTWTDSFTGHGHRGGTLLDELLEVFPVALLVRS